MQPLSLKMVDKHPSPFVIHIEDEKLEILRTKLSSTILPDELDQAEWDYGVPLAEIKRLHEYWRTQFDWRTQEAKLNSLPQYSVEIRLDNDFGTLNIHFVHQRSQLEKAIPLLFIHGCKYTRSR